MAAMKALRFDAHVHDGDLLPVYALVGEDDALVSSCIASLKNAVERPELPGSMTTDLDGEPEPREVFDELRTQPFMAMAGRRLVIVRRGGQFVTRNGEALKEYLGAPSPSAVLVLCAEKLDGRTAAVKAISRVGAAVDCSRIRWQDARDWVNAEARRMGRTLTPRAASALVEAVGPNVAGLRQELEKLILYAGEESTIEERDVEAVVPGSRARSIFELSDAIARADAGEAMRLGEQMLLRGERLEGIVAFLANRTRMLWQTRRLLDAGTARGDVAKALGVPDFVAGRAMESARKLPDGWFQRRMRLLAEADVELKTTSIQSREHGVWLGALLARLCQ